MATGATAPAHSPVSATPANMPYGAKDDATMAEPAAPAMKAGMNTTL
jgi:hypothetical protein